MIRILIVEDHEMVRDAIASLLGEVFSLKTVETHRTSINRKLAVRTTADLIRCALAHGVTVGPRVSSDEVHSELTARDRPQAG